jgi:UDP-N-acetylmuramoyl-tripeptide--D-alanyl-D-alanine ligase
VKQATATELPLTESSTMKSTTASKNAHVPFSFFSGALAFFQHSIETSIKEYLAEGYQASQSDLINLLRGARMLSDEGCTLYDSTSFRTTVKKVISLRSERAPGNTLEHIHEAALLLSELHRNHSPAKGFSASLHDLLDSTTFGDRLDADKTDNIRHRPGPIDYELMWLLAETWRLRQLPLAYATLEKYCRRDLARLSSERLNKHHRYLGFFSLMPAPLPDIADDILLQHLFRSNYLRSTINSDPWKFFEQVCLYLTHRPNDAARQFLTVLLQKEIERHLASSRYHERATLLDTTVEICRVLRLFLLVATMSTKPKREKRLLVGKPIWTTASVVSITSGQLLPANAPETTYSMGTFILDKIQPDALFISPDIHWAKKYTEQKLNHRVLQEKGATALLCSNFHPDITGDIPIIQVRNTYTAMLKLALENRRRYSGKVIGVTGSVGKTSTSTMIQRLLSRSHPTYKNLDYFNHQTGVPKSVANIPQTASFAIIEMGMGQPQSILPKSVLARPDIALVTDIQHDHMEFHQSIDSIIATKMEILEGLPANGTMILNRDSEHYPHMLGIAKARRPKLRLLGFGEHPLADVRALAIDIQPGHSDVEVMIDGERRHYRLSMPGRHMVQNSLAALATLVALQLDMTNYLPVFEEIRPVSGRNELIDLRLSAEKTIYIINDVFNTNPASMRSSFHLLSLMNPKGQGRRIMVAEGMEELGEKIVEYHQSLAVDANRSRINIFFTIGKHIEYLGKELQAPIVHQHFPSWEQLFNTLLGSLNNGDLVCFKGTAREGVVEKILKALLAQGQQTSAYD